jgi:opacity protein-like surface antigen
MMRKLALALAALAAIGLGSASSALAMHGGGGAGGHGSFGHGYGGVQHFGFHDQHDFAFHHHSFRHHRFVFLGAPFYDYGYGYDSCYARVWTKWGWRLVSECY